MISRRDEARAARQQIEEALDAAASSSGWLYTPRLSGWVDSLVIIEESER